MHLPVIDSVKAPPSSRQAQTEPLAHPSSSAARTMPEAAPPMERIPGEVARAMVDGRDSGLLSAHEARIALDLARAAMPAFGGLPAPGPALVTKLSTWLSEAPITVRRSYLAGLWAFEASAVLSKGRPFTKLSAEQQAELLERRQQSPRYLERTMITGLVVPLKWMHFDAPEMSAHVGCRYELPQIKDETPRWMAQVTDGREVEEDLELECEVVVVGTGAGGAAVAYELARRGRAVLMLEEGDYHRRASFRGRFGSASREMYRDRALTIALGNVGIPVWAGRAVGGSTVVNSGTCYRAPDRVLDRWVRELGLPSDFSPAGLSPFYDQVETMLGVAPADPAYAGKIAGLIARGADRLGYSHGVLRRNAPGCDGQGVCCLGCPTGAKRSTDVSYVPEALLRGAQLVTAAHVKRVDIVGGRARGVTAELRGKNGKRSLVVKADAVVVAGGTLMTPLLLRRSGACRTSRMLGKNLSIHPASKVIALFDEKVSQWDGIPQSYAIDQFAEEGLLFEGASVPYELAATAIPWTGKRFMELMDQFPHLATFGFMIEDTSRGEVREGPNGSPLMFYNVNKRDMAQLQRGLATLCEVFQAAGARRVLPFAAGHDDVSTKAALEKLRGAALAPGSFDLTAFHPLGTCRVGTDPRTSCVGPDHQAHDVGGLYVADGSAVPSALGRNPQMTIMAMGLRAAERIHGALG